jgi:glycogen debranching enzyme
VALSLIRPDILYAWKGCSLLIVTARGDCTSEHRLSGYYYREARFLRTCRLQIDGRLPWLCEAAALSPETLQFTYVHPEVARYGGGGTGQSGDDEPRDERGLPQRGLIIQVVYHVVLDGLEVSARIHNTSRTRLEFEVGWALDADFADIQEAQSDERRQHAPVRTDHTADRLAFHYEQAELPYSTTLHLPPSAGWHRIEGGVAASIQLQSSEWIDFAWRVSASAGPTTLSERDIRLRTARLDAWRSRFTSVATPRNRIFEDVLARSIRDVGSLPLLDGQEDEWLALQAGLPLYPALFGRDALTAGWQVGYVDRGEALDAALTRLGRLQSTRVDDWRDEEPGRIPYQIRLGPLAVLNVNPYSAYYADFASPLMFVISLANLYAWTGEEAALTRHWDTARRILDWARDRGDADGDGYLEYFTRSREGTKNQGWKDSGDAIVYDDGSPVPPPIATCELQGYWFAAQQLMGVLSWMRGHGEDARAYLASAADLKQRFNRDWWVEDRRFFALARDPEKRLVGAVTSNVGHCLATGIIDADHLPPVVGRLFAPDMFSGWGIRTLSCEHRYYNPLSYHRGTVWPVEQATILFGLRRFGFDARALDLAAAMFDLAQLYPEYRTPECVGGFPRREQQSPGAYPQANAPQLWNASALPLLVQTLLGLVPLASYGLLVVDPLLPAWLPDVVMHDLRVGNARVSLRFWREADGSSQFAVLATDGSLRVVRQPPPESLSATPLDRLAALADTAWQYLPFTRKEERAS